MGSRGDVGGLASSAVRERGAPADRTFKLIAAAGRVVSDRVHRLRGRAGPEQHQPHAGDRLLEGPAPGRAARRSGGPGLLPAPPGRRGRPGPLAWFRGSPVIVNFFASWCPDCRSELAAVGAVATQNSGRVAVVGIDTNDGNGAAAATLLTAAHADYPVGVDSGAKVATRYLLTALPVTYFVDAEGWIVGSALGTPEHRLSQPMGRATDEIAVSVEVHGRGIGPRRPAGGRPHGGRAGRRAAGRRPCRRLRKERAPDPPQVRVLDCGGLRRTRTRWPGLEHLFSAAGLNPSPAAHTTTTTTAAAGPTPLPAGQQNQISASLASFMGLSLVPATPAPPIDLIDQSGEPYALTAPNTKATVLTFFDGSCDDICPVLAAEIVQADTDLGAEAARVEFVTVNTDPSALSVSGLADAESASNLSALPNWVMLTGPLSTMDAVWKSYGITITVVQKTRVEAHNNFGLLHRPAGARALPAPPRSPTRAGPAPPRCPRPRSSGGPPASPPTLSR